MTVDESGSDPDLSEEAQAAIARALAQADHAAQIAEQQAHVLKITVPLEQLDRLLELWIKARRLDEGATRPMKADHLARQVKLAKTNPPLLALIRAAYRAGIYDTLYSTDQEQQP